MTEITIPDIFGRTEIHILCDLVKAIHKRHKEFGDGITFTFRPLKSVDGNSYKFMMTSNLRPFRFFQVDAPTFEEAIGKMYVMLEEQLP